MSVDITSVVTLIIVFSIISALFASFITALVIRVKSQSKIAALQNELNLALQTKEQQTNMEGQITQTFEALASRVLHQNSNMYLQQTKEQMSGFVSPLMRDIQKLEAQIQNVEKNREGAYSKLDVKLEGLGHEIINLHKTNQELRTSAEHLHGALKSDTATRGRWGEIQLRRIVEMAGMVKHIDFEEQVHVKGGEGFSRPDMIIHLPHEGVVPVDAKVPMNAYLKACATRSEREKDIFLKEHKNALNTHIKQLSAKEYWNQFEKAPQVVILFLPYESGFEASVTSDPTLLDNALDKKVIIAGPSTLYAFLKVISYGWMQVELSKNAAHIAKVSKDLVQRFEKFYELFSKVGKNLNSAVNSFNDSSRSLESRLVPKMNEIKTLRGDKENLSEEGFFIESHARE